MAFGLTPQGFVTKRQSDIQAGIQASLQTAFGESINLLPESVFGQIVGIFSAELALVWEMGEAVYDSEYPTGAEGVAVDNILALSGLKRLPATPTRTSQETNGIQGLLLFGNPAAVIPKDSLISILGQPQFQFTLDADVTIASPTNCVQVVYFTSVPTTGTFKIQIGMEETTAINYNDIAAQIQTKVRALTGYGDITVTGSYATGFVINFLGASGGQVQPLILIQENSLMNGMTVVNVKAVINNAGAPAQGIGSATCTQTGPIPAPANTLTVISTPVSGWSSVTNPLDCVTGTNLETDTEALQRRALLEQSEGNGPLLSIVQKVELVPTVSAAIGFENRNGAAIQNITFSDIPTGGSFQLFIAGLLTSSIIFSASAADVQSALRALPGYENINVSGDFQFGFAVDFNGSQGGQEQALLQVLNNTLNDGPSITSTVAYGRPGHSFEIVVVGGDDTSIAQTIFDSKPAGIQTYGSTTVNVVDTDGNIYPISFSRPSEATMYVAITMTVQTATFPSDGVTQIQEELVAIGDAVPIGGLVVGFGTNGLIGAFNNVPGIISYSLNFGLSPGPTENVNIQMLPQQRAFFETFNIIVNITYV